jgi:glutamyl aminopeptidase
MQIKSLNIFRRLRTTILNLACSCGYEECLSAVTVPFVNWINDPTDPNKKPKVNTRHLIYNFGIERKGAEGSYWDKMWDLYKKETDPQEKLKMMISLTYVKEDTLLRKYLKLAEDESNVRGQDYFTVLQSMSDNDIGREIVWSYVRYRFLTEQTNNFKY